MLHLYIYISTDLNLFISDYITAFLYYELYYTAVEWCVCMHECTFANADREADVMGSSEEQLKTGILKMSCICH